MSEELHEKFTSILDDMRRELKDLREERNFSYERIQYIDAKEIEVLNGIEQLKGIIDNLQREGD